MRTDLLTLAVELATAACSQTGSSDKVALAPADIVKSRILQLMEVQRLPSVCAAVVKDGEAQFEECFGFADLEKKVTATPDTMYALASMTKPLTATGLMTLVERGRVDLDRPANDYLGDAKLVAYVGDASGATVRRLLHCTSGLPEHVNIYYANEKWRRPPMEQSIRRYGFLVTAPGEVYTYSNFGYGVLEHIIERVSGQEYAAFLKAQVFDPLGMTRTAVLTEPAADDAVAVKYDDKRQPLAINDYDHRGASAAYGSIRDLVKLARFVSKVPLPGQKRILRDKTIDQMLNSKSTDIPANLLRLGWTGFEHEGYGLIHASGGMPGAASRLGIVPEARLISVVLTNALTPDLWEIERTVFAAYLPGYAERTRERKPDQPAPSRAFSPPPPWPAPGREASKPMKAICPRGWTSLPVGRCALNSPAAFCR